MKLLSLSALLLASSTALADATFEFWAGDNKLKTLTYPWSDQGNSDGHCVQPSEAVDSIKLYEGTDTGTGSGADIESDYCVYTFKTDSSCNGKADKKNSLFAGNYGFMDIDEAVSMVIRKQSCPKDIPEIIPLDEVE